MADILGIFNHIQQQGEKGKQSRLARMLGEAYNAPMGQRQEALGRIAQVDGGLAMQAGRQFREEDGEVLSQLSDHARQVVALYKADPNMAQQAYQAMLPLAQRAGITTAPQQLDDTIIGGLTQLAAVNSKAGVPAEFQSFDLFTQAGGLGEDERARAARIQLGLDPRASSAAITYREVEGPDGRTRLVALDPRQVGAQAIGSGAAYGSGVPSPQAPLQAPQGIPPGVTPQQVQAAFQAIGARNGFEITSMQRPVMPGIGAGANSQHPNGTAVDYRTRGKSPEQIEALKRDLAAAGFEVIDESDGRSGTGPHIHAELPPSFGGGAPAGADPFTSRRPEDEAYATEQAKRRAELEAAPAMQAVETQGRIDEMVAERGIKPTKAQEAVDTQYGKEYVEFMQGGAADANKALSELSGVIQQLDSGENLTGPGLGLLPKFVKERVAARAQDAQETVESTVQRSLRVILGAQFTEKEGERLIARAYNPNLPEEVNRVRVQRLFQQLKEGFENKAAAARYYEENGTLRGFTGKLPSWGDFNPDSGAPQQNRSAAGGQSSGKRLRFNPATGRIE